MFLDTVGTKKEFDRMQFVMGAATAAVFSSKFLPHTYGLPYYKRFAQLYHNGFEVNLDQDTKELAQEVLDSMSLKPETECKVCFFVAFGQDMISKGSVHVRSGAAVGLPANFKYKTPDDVERQKVTVNNHPINWESSGGHMLTEAMVLSPAAKKFAITREMFSIRSYRYLVEALIASACFYSSYAVGFALNRSLRLKEKTPRSFRGLVYGAIGSLGLLVYVLSMDTYNCYQDRKLDRKVVKLDSSLVGGGVEYYNKLLQRNIALRTLLGETGLKKYTIYGNEMNTWRSPSESLTNRRDFMIDTLKHVIQEQNES